MAKLDWLDNNDNILGSGIAGLLRGTGNVAKSLFRGAGSLRDRMSQRDSGSGSWGDVEENYNSPIKSGGGGDSGDSGEVLIRLTSIENILRGMSELATQSDQRDAATVETDRQAQEALHRLAERPDEPDISMSPVRVEEAEEKKSGGIFSKIFGGLTRFAEFLGPVGSVIAGLTALGVAGFGAKKLWDWASEDDGLIGNVTEGLEKSFEVIGEVIKETLGDSLYDIGFGIRDSVMESIRSLDWDEALRLFAGAGALPVVAGRVVQGTANLGAQGIQAGGRGAGWLANRGVRPPTGPTSILGNQMVRPGPAGPEQTQYKWTKTSRGMKYAPVRVRTPGPLEFAGRAATEGADEATRSAGAIARATAAVERAAPGTARALRIGGVAARGLGAVAGVGATAYDIYKYQEMEDENAKLWKLGAIGVGGLAAVLGGVALIVGSGGLLAPLVLGLAAGGASIYADTLEEGARGEGDTSPTRAPRRTAGGRGNRGEGVGAFDDDFQMFPTYEAGRAAQEAVWKTSNYQDLPVSEAVQRWAGDGAPPPYVKAMVAAAGGHDILMKDVTDSNFNKMMDEQREHEGWDAGTIRNGVKTDGTRSWGNNNPGNIKWTNATRTAYTASPMVDRAPVDTGATTSRYAGTVPAGTGPMVNWSTPTTGRVAASLPAGPGANTEPEATTAVVAPQTTNNYNDNRTTNVMPATLDPRNREAGVVALQNLQGLTAALG